MQPLPTKEDFDLAFLCQMGLSIALGALLLFFALTAEFGDEFLNLFWRH